MTAEKTEGWNSAVGCSESARLNNATVVRLTLTRSKFPEPKILEIVSKNDLFPLQSSDTDSSPNHSSLDCSSSSYIYGYPSSVRFLHDSNKRNK